MAAAQVMCTQLTGICQERRRGHLPGQRMAAVPVDGAAKVPVGPTTISSRVRVVPRAAVS